MTVSKHSIAPEKLAQVKHYVAYWFQVGTPVIFPTSDRQVRPNVVLQGENYTPEFEACWREILSEDDCYLQGTDQTIKALLSYGWDITKCPRCEMPIPVDAMGAQIACPCAELAAWPNLALPNPHSAEECRQKITHLRKRLKAKGQRQKA